MKQYLQNFEVFLDENNAYELELAYFDALKNLPYLVFLDQKSVDLLVLNYCVLSAL
jgi:hypothetical protein